MQRLSRYIVSAVLLYAASAVVLITVQPIPASKPWIEVLVPIAMFTGFEFVLAYLPADIFAEMMFGKFTGYLSIAAAVCFALIYEGFVFISFALPVSSTFSESDGAGPLIINGNYTERGLAELATASRIYALIPIVFLSRFSTYWTECLT